MLAWCIQNSGSAGIKAPSIQQFANDTASLIDVLGIKKPVDILGLSMGGFITQELALLHPDKVNRLIIYALIRKKQ